MTEALSNIAVCVFDAYGTLFDVNWAVEQCQTATNGSHWPNSGVPNSFNTPGSGA